MDYLDKVTAFKEKRCAKCGKVFVPTYNYVFTKNGKYWCKWTCWNHREDKDEGTRD